MTYFSNVNVGSAPNDGTGDSLRQSFITLNNNFSYINQTIWPDISQKQLSTDVISTYISKFNLAQAATIESTKFGNTGATFFGNTFTSSNSFQGQLGKYGGNAAIVSTLSATGNVTVANLTVNGTAQLTSITIDSLNNTVIGNVTPAAGTFTVVTSGSDVVMNGNLTGVGFIVKTVSDALYSNLGSAFTLTLSPGAGRRSITGVTMNVNTTISYASITTGCERVLVLRNLPDGTAREVVLPNSFNNKGTSTIPIGANANVMFQFIPFDTTESNVYVNITNS